MVIYDPTTSDEVWYPIPGVPGYQLSSELRIRTPAIKCDPWRGHYALEGEWRIVKMRISSTGYIRFNCKLDGRWRRFGLHQAVAWVAYGPTPHGLITRHYDDDKMNNYASNLCPGTVADNSDDMKRNKGQAIGERVANSVLTPDVVRLIRRKMRDDGRSMLSLSREFGVGYSTICNIKMRRTWDHLD